MKIHVNDTVLVTAGKDKGRTGKIESVIVKKDKVLIPGINVYKRARRAQGGADGGLIEFSRPLPLSSIALLCPHCKKPTRIGYRITKNEKTRICRKCNRQIDTQEKGKK